MNAQCFVSETRTDVEAQLSCCEVMKVDNNDADGDNVSMIIKKTSSFKHVA